MPCLAKRSRRAVFGSINKGRQSSIRSPEVNAHGRRGPTAPERDRQPRPLGGWTYGSQRRCGQRVGDRRIRCKREFDDPHIAGARRVDHRHTQSIDRIFTSRGGGADVMHRTTSARRTNASTRLLAILSNTGPTSIDSAALLNPYSSASSTLQALPSDPTGLNVQAPSSFENGPLHQPHVDLLARHMRIARDEALMDAAECEPDLGRDAVRMRLQHGGVIAPRQKLGVLRHVGDQIETSAAGACQINTDL